MRRYANDLLPGHQPVTSTTFSIDPLRIPRVPGEEALDVVQPEVGRIGGLTEASGVAIAARDRGLLVMPHCWKSAIGIAASLQLTAVTPHCPFIEFLPAALADSRLRRNLAAGDLAVVHGRLPLPDAPWLGVTLNEESLAEFRVP
jgi:L-alanine-DL-glutamate epimerase-like enolase superfamily enzyme